MNTFLMELLSEEIPASDQIFGRQFLEDYFSKKLSSVELSYSEIIINRIKIPCRSMTNNRPVSGFYK